MVLVLEQEEEGVPPELEQHPVVCAGVLEHGAEHLAQGRHQLFPAHPAALGESLRERREARDVRVAECPVDGPPQALRRIDRPVDRERRDVSAKAAHFAESTKPLDVARFHVYTPVSSRDPSGLPQLYRDDDAAFEFASNSFSSFPNAIRPASLNLPYRRFLRLRRWSEFS
jgi:hypothetical protein